MLTFETYYADRQLCESLEPSPNRTELAFAGNKATAWYEVEGREYDFEASSRDGRTWSVAFKYRYYPDKANDPDTFYHVDRMTGGGAMTTRVIGTAFYYVRDLLQKKRPDGVRFSAAAEASKQGVYDRLCQRMAGEYGYVVVPQPTQAHAKEYLLVRSDLAQAQGGGYPTQGPAA